MNPANEQVSLTAETYYHAPYPEQILDFYKNYPQVPHSFIITHGSEGSLSIGC